MQDEQIYALALTRIHGLGLTGAYNLLREMGTAADIFRYRKELPQRIPGVSEKLVQALDCPEAIMRAEEELRFAEKNNIRCITISDEQYPARLKECEDAPLVLFYRGNASLNALRVVSVVGTRHATSYGEEICRQFMKALAEACPDTLVVSGLAYGIDIHAHRSALQNGLPTVGVLAHGLDRIYPSSHRETAVEMMDNGGLLTEFMSGTNPDRQNFVKRNRIVAGMCDAVVVVESAAKGGALITAELAESYHRDCFAFPGKVTDTYSAGCNRLIKNNRASLIVSVEDFIENMGWKDANKYKTQPIQRQLFPDLTEEETKVVEVLQKADGGVQINVLVIETNIPIHRISTLLFDLEMKGVVQVLAGSMYRLC